MSNQSTGPGNQAGSGATPHLRDYLNIILRHRLIVAGCFVALVGWSVLTTLTTQPSFRAVTTVHIEPDAPKILSFQEMFPVEGFAYDFYQTQYQLIGSRAVAWRVVEREGLVDHPDFGGSAGAELGPIARSARWVRRLPKAGARWLRSLAGTTPPMSERGDVEGRDANPAHRAATDAVLGGLSVEAVRDTRIAQISWSGTDPVMAARMADAVAAAYIELSLEAKYETTQQANDFLTTEIDRLRGEISSASVDLQEFGSDVLSLDERQDTVTQALGDLSSEYTKALTSRVEAEATYRQLQAAQPSTLPQVYTHSLIQGLKADYAALERRHTEMGRTYTDEWAEMRQLKAQMTSASERIDAEEQRLFEGVLTNAKQQFDASLERESKLRGLLDSQKDDAVEMNRTLLQFQALQVGIDNKKRMLDSLLERQSETAVSSRLQGLQTSNIRVVDNALIPDAPYAPSLKMNLLLGMLVGSMLGFGAAFFFDYMDNTLKSTEEVEAYLGLPALAAIPRARDAGLGGRYGYGYGYGETQEDREATRVAPDTPAELISSVHPRSLVAEAFRSLRTAVLLSQAGKPPRVVAVTSANPSEGKTTTAVNLAISLAQAGKRVLLVDADMRKPRLDTVFETESSGGLVAALVGGETVIRPTMVDNLWLLPAGQRPPNPAELLGSDNAGEVIGFGTANFDMVVIDTPPVLAVVDAQVIAGHADGVVLVADSRRTPRPDVRLARRRLEAVGGKVLGVTLNRARPTSAGYVSYGYGAGGGGSDGRTRRSWQERLVALLPAPDAVAARIRPLSNAARRVATSIRQARMPFWASRQPLPAGNVAVASASDQITQGREEK